MGAPILEIRQLGKSFGTLRAVEGVSFQVQPGQCLGLLGPNGAGKTTTISMITGLITPDAGEVLIAGRKLAGDCDATKRRIGLVPQDLALYEELTNDDKVEYNGYAHSFAGMGVQFILMAAIEMGVGILLERQRGLWKRLRSAPLSRGVLLGSKAASITLISAFTLAVCFGFARVLFGVKVQGSLPGFFLCIVAFSLFAASVGLLLASFGTTPGAARGLAIPVVLIMVMLGGAWVPAFVFPQWLQTATLAVPTRWALDCLDAMTWRGLGFEAALAPIAVLLGYAAVFGWVAVKRFEWEAD